MMNYMKAQKAELRSKLLAEREAISPEKRAAMSDAICGRAVSLSGFRLAQTILLYAPKQIEVDVIPIARAAWNAGKKVAFPRCHRPEGGFAYMTYHIVDSLDELSPGSFGLLEPSEDAALYDPQSDTRGSLAFAPGIAFDRSGYRLGYGGGYYDRFFNAYSGSVVGVIFSDFLVPQLPHGRYDIRAGLIITEKGVRPTLEN